MRRVFCGDGGAELGENSPRLKPFVRRSPFDSLSLRSSSLRAGSRSAEEGLRSG